MATGQVTKEIVTKSKLDNLANSISTKSGVSTPMTIDQMKVAVEGIISGTKGAIYQDEQGYLVVAKDADIPIQIDSLTVTQDGTYTALANHAYNPVVVNTAPAPPNYYVKFIDYDGTELYSYTHTQFNALSAMPANPSHTGLVAQGWNWTLAEAKEQILNSPKQDLIIGQLYTTSSGNTQIYIQLDDIDYLHPYLTLWVNGTVQINWGDNSTIQQFYDSGNKKYYDHEYSTTGNYIIQITVVSGSIRLSGSYINYSYVGMLRSTNSSSSSSSMDRVAYQIKIKYIRIGNGVERIMTYAFENCYSLVYITIPNVATMTIGDYIFYNCKSLKAITIPSRNNNSIGEHCFQCCSSLQKVSLPRNMQYFYEFLFSECYSLQEITIPYDAYSIDNSCFKQCGLKNIEIPILYGEGNGGYWDSYCFQANFFLQSINFNNNFYSGINYIPVSTFQECYGLREITIPSGITSIGQQAFSACYNLQKVILPNTVTSIDNNAFLNCYSLSEITIPSGVTSIGQGAFSACQSLQEITIPSGVTIINNGVFNGCYSLTKITIPNTVTYIDTYAFYYCYRLQEITIPNGVTGIDTYAFGYCYSLREMTIPNTVTRIGDYAFYYCYSLRKITIPSTVTSIGNNAFDGCYDLQEITIPSGVISIGSSAFQYCYPLTEITIPNTVTSIGGSAFANCSNLITVTLSNIITSINSNTFYYCSSLSRIAIPNTVTSIGGYAFYYCRSLQNITIPANVTSISNNAFYNCTNMKEYHLLPTTPPTLGGTGAFYGIPSDCIIYVPQGCLSAYQSASNWSTHASKMQEEPT